MRLHRSIDSDRSGVWRSMASMLDFWYIVNLWKILWARDAASSHGYLKNYDHCVVAIIFMNRNKNTFIDCFVWCNEKFHRIPESLIFIADFSTIFSSNDFFFFFLRIRDRFWIDENLEIWQQKGTEFFGVNSVVVEHFSSDSVKFCRLLYREIA